MNYKYFLKKFYFFIFFFDKDEIVFFYFDVFVDVLWIIGYIILTLFHKCQHLKYIFNISYDLILKYLHYF